jgi:hypothetical protein
MTGFVLLSGVHGWGKMSGVHQPDGPAFDIVLVLHVACVAACMVTVVTSAAIATRLSRLLQARAPLPDALLRYFRPGVNWAGRSVYGIPVFGFSLLALSHGAYSLRHAWVGVGLAILVVVVVLTEATLWPAERRIQASLEAWILDTPVDTSVAQDAKVMAFSAIVALALLVAGSAIMVVQP